MVITINQIQEAFSKLLSEKIARESVADWSSNLQRAFDDRDLIFEPKDAEEQIWDAILFLEGIDLKDAPNSYLHNEKDIQRYYKKFKKLAQD